MRTEAHEQAADAAADRITAAPESSSLRSGPLHPTTRAFMETRFQHDFSRVRVHTDHESARNLNAYAYTKNNDIVIGREGLALDSVGRHRLLAHELTHVVQQSRGVAHGIQRKPLVPHGKTNYRFDSGQINADDLKDPEIQERLSTMTRDNLRAYLSLVTDPFVRAHIIGLLAAPPTLEEGGVHIKREHVDAAISNKYWWPRTSRAYKVGPIPSEMGPDEESDRVFAVLWNVWPDGPPTGSATELVTIPPSATQKKSRLYEFRVSPPAAQGDKPELNIRFVMERDGAMGEAAPQPPSTFKTPATLAISSGVGNIDPEQWLQDHPDERRQIAFWLERQSGTFDGVLITRSVPKDGKGPPLETMVRLQGTKVKGKPVEDLSFEIISDQKPRVVAPPDDFRARDYADLLIHEAQTKPHTKLRDKLGEVDVSGVPASEVFAVKYAVVSYWNKGSRDVEVDAVLPMPGSNKQIFYTLRFLVDGDVSTERVGEKGSDAKLDPKRLDVARAHGFADNSSDPAKLKGWLKKRYPGVTPAGTTVTDLRESASKAMVAGVGAAKWYDDNYKIIVLEGAAARTRLKTKHHLVNKQVPPAEMKSFTAAELTFAELTLQTFQDRILAMMKTLRLGRQQVARKADGSERKTTGGRAVGGVSFSTGSDRTVMIYDSGSGSTTGEFKFLGGAEGTHDPGTELLAHEFGHVVEGKAGARAAFNKFVKREGIKPFTTYAGEDPDKEFFAEAFSIYQTDPEFLRTNYKPVFDWLDELAKTGKVPKS